MGNETQSDFQFTTSYQRAHDQKFQRVESHLEPHSLLKSRKPPLDWRDVAFTSSARSTHSAAGRYTHLHESYTHKRAPALTGVSHVNIYKTCVLPQASRSAPSTVGLTVGGSGTHTKATHNWKAPYRFEPADESRIQHPRSRPLTTPEPASSWTTTTGDVHRWPITATYPPRDAPPAAKYPPVTSTGPAWRPNSARLVPTGMRTSSTEVHRDLGTQRPATAPANAARAFSALPGMYLTTNARTYGTFTRFP